MAEKTNTLNRNGKVVNMTLKDFIEYITSVDANNNTELWICDNDGHYIPLRKDMIEKDMDNSINIHTGIY